MEVPSDEQSKAVAALVRTLAQLSLPKRATWRATLGASSGLRRKTPLALSSATRCMRSEPLPPDGMISRFRRYSKRRKVKQTQQVSLSVAIPLVRGAYDESREGLRDAMGAAYRSRHGPRSDGLACASRS